MQRRHLIAELAGRGLDAQGVIVADDENLDIATEFGFATVEMDNHSLGARFNAGYQLAAEEGADYFVHIGSDDWMHPDCFDRLADLEQTHEPPPWPTPEQPIIVVSYGETIPILCGRSMLVVDLCEERATVIHPTGQFGVVPWILPRRALEPSAFEPIDTRAQRGIDACLTRSIPKARPIFHDPSDCARVDFKSDVNITPYGALTHIGGETCDPWALLAEHYPLSLVEQARELAERGALV